MAPRTWAALAITVTASLTILGGFAVKSNCTFHDWSNYYQYRHYCYSDILPLYQIRHLDHDAVPYLEEFTEYPVLTGALSYFAALLSDSLASYLTLTFFLLALCAFAATIALQQSGLSLPRVLAWSASPTLFVHAYTNWDLLAVACTAGGWWQWRRNRPFGSALLFGLGGAAKLYPALFLPFLAVAALRSGFPRALPYTAAGAFLGLGVPNLLVALAAPHNWAAIWSFHAARDPDFETPWGVAHDAATRLWPALAQGHAYRDLVDGVGLFLLALVATVLLVRQWQRGIDPLVAGGAFVLTFLVTIKVFSPQYALWTLPLLLLLGAPSIPILGFVLSDAGNFLIRYQLFIPPPGQTEGWNPTWLAWSHAAVLLRWFFLVWALVAVLGPRWTLHAPWRSPTRIGRETKEPGPPGVRQP